MEIEYIKANDPKDNLLKSKRIERFRVAAYIRVSTDTEEQIKSFDSMVEHYTNLIKSNVGWEFAGIYADRAITGTKVDKREEFQKLIQDALDGKIDLILAKSIPRFARNTLDTLKYVRLLKEHNVGVQFEVEKINTLKDGEFLITILSSVAQQEVENTSAYVKKGLKMKMKRGELVGFQGCMGYDYDPETKSIVINEEEAEVVRYIFQRYIEGAGGTIIARELNERGLTTKKGNAWGYGAVLGILANEKYKGDILMGKTFTVDAISKRRLMNHGEEDRYYIRDHHEPIVTEDMFEKAREIRMKRAVFDENGNTIGNRQKYSRQFAFSCIIECGFCGGRVSRRCWHSGTQYEKVIWQCQTSTKKGKKYCPDSKGISEEVLEKAFVMSYKMLCADNKEILDDFLKRVECSLNPEEKKEKISALLKEIDALEKNRKKLLDKYLDDGIEKNLYTDKDKEIVNKIEKLTIQVEALEEDSLEDKSLKRRLKEFREALSENQIMEEFDRAVFESVIEKVIVGGYDDDGNKDPYRITFVYKTGFKSHIDNAKEKFKKESSISSATSNLSAKLSTMYYNIEGMRSNLCTNIINNDGLLCLNIISDECGSYSEDTEGIM